MSKFDTYFQRLKQHCSDYLQNGKITTQDALSDSYISYVQEHRLLHILPATLATVKQAQKSQHARGLKHSAELLQIFALFSAENLEVLTFKGPALSQILYKNSCTRFYKDIDIWADKKDIPKIVTHLSTLGYHTTIEDVKNYINAKKYKDISLKHRQKNIEIELHWQITNVEDNYYLTFENAWKNKETLIIHGQEISTLSKQDNYRFLCFHAYRHFYRRLNWLLDIAILQKKERIIPKTVAELSADYLIKTLFQKKEIPPSLAQKIMLKIIKQDPSILRNIKIVCLKTCFILLSSHNGPRYFVRKCKRKLGS